MPRRYSYDREDDDGRYRLREREQSTCATGSCSEYGNYLTIRPGFPSRNDIRNRRSYYNRDRHDSDIDVIYESKSYTNFDRSSRVTRHNSILKNESSELIPVIDSRDIGADSHFIQSRLGIRRKKNPDYVYTRRGKYIRNRTDSESSFERFSPERIRVSPVREAKEWLGPLDGKHDKPFKIKVSKLRSSPERSSSNNHLLRNSKSPSPRVKLYSRSTSPLIRRSLTPEKKRKMSRSTSPFDIPTKNPKLKRRSTPLKKKKDSPIKSESELKLFPLLKKKKKEYETKSKEKIVKKKVESPQNLSPPRGNSLGKESSDEFPSHRRDTIASRLKQKKVFKYPIPFTDSSYTEEEVDSKFTKKKIDTEIIEEKAAELIEMVKTVVGKPRRTKYFDSSLKVGREGKMRKLDVSSDCKLKSCDDSKPKKRMNFGKKYGRYAYEPPRDNKYLSESKEKMKSRKSTEKDRVSFKDPEVPEVKKSSFKLNTTLLKRSSLKKKLKMFRSSISPPDTSSLQKATQSKFELNPETEEENEKSGKEKFEKTLSEDSTKKFYHKTVLENYPDETDHLRNYHEEFRKDRFKSDLFNPTDHNPPVILPSVYPKAKKRYNYSGILEDSQKKPSSTTYVKREPRKDSGSKVGESFFDLSINNKNDSISKEVLTKEDIKENEKKEENEIDFRPISLASVGKEEEEEEITMPDNEVVSTILEIEEPKASDSFKENNKTFQNSQPNHKKVEKKENFKEKRRKSPPQEKEKQKDWRFRKKVDFTEIKRLGRKPSEVELASDERLVSDIVGHAAMHNWEQAENYHQSRNKYKMYVPRIVKRQQARERRAREIEAEEEEENMNEEEEKKENAEEEEAEVEELEVKRPPPKKRFRGKRINPRSRFDGGYDLLQVADSDTSVEMDNSGSRMFLMPKPEKKKEGTISKFAKRLFTSKRNEESKEDLEKSIRKTSQNAKPPKRKVSFSFPPNE